MSIPSRLAAFCGLLAALLAAPAGAQDKPVTIRFPVEYAADVTPGLANQEFVKRMAERSNGRIKVEFFPGGSLYKGLDLLQAVVRGDADMTTLVSAYWVGASPRIGVFDLPYAFPTHEAFYRAADDQAFRDLVFSEMESKGVKVLGLLPYDYVVPGTRNRALVKPEDFKGLKLRAVGRVNASGLQALGATAVPINITEVSTSIQQGVIDGLNTPADAFVSYRFYEVVKNLTYAKYYFAFYPWTVNARFWNGLPEGDRKLIGDVVAEVVRDHRSRARQAADEAMATLKKNGVAVHEQTPEEQKAWAQAMAKVWTDAESQFGKELIQRVRSFGN